MMGRVFMAKGEYAKAVESLQRVISQTENWSAKRWKCCKHAISSWVKLPNGQNSCSAVEENTGADAELMLADIIEARDGSEAAQVYITRQLQRHPTMRVFHKLMDYHLNEAEEGRAKESLMVLRDMVGEKVRSKPVIAARNVVLPHTPSTGIVRLVGHGQPLNQFAVLMACNFLKKSDFSYNILIIDVLLCSGTDGAEKPARGEIATVNFFYFHG